ncbi:MAG: anaerobic ribonucleoside-triphosphate reductase activating protein [Peptostreptococcaceae bacterium]|nr:anaerobic ribonucleoside-triphosphate reductase activating protein [Peptostreptococcaceae bacterium]
MRYGQIRQFDIANGEGIRTSIFVTGCTHCCRGCFNKEYQDFDAGMPWTDQETRQVIEYLKDPMIKGLSLLGGEPFQNAVGLAEIVREIKKESPKDIWVYSGYTFEQICADDQMKELLILCDVLVDGLFVEEKKDLRLRFRGSSNQRIIDIAPSLEKGQAVEYILR